MSFSTKIYSQLPNESRNFATTPCLRCLPTLPDSTMVMIIILNTRHTGKDRKGSKDGVIENIRDSC
jgi:hypothetical protein